jgi:hypothetical protein
LKKEFYFAMQINAHSPEIGHPANGGGKTDGA